jgi:hypothetical protein|tara:strand:+ start:193 stop:657 length:465 start_codon:yes stop_codon:yes gene_type:complete
MIILQKRSKVVCIKNEKKPRKSVRVTKKRIKILKNELRQYLDSNGYLSYSTKKKKYLILGTNSPTNGLTQCTQCGIGQLMIIRSPTTKKRFIGCSNYSNGCTASSPLPQKARLRSTKKLCENCHWPLILYTYSRKQKWTEQCSNIQCKTRKTTP